MCIRTLVCAMAATTLLAPVARAQLVFEFTKGPGFLALEGSDPAKAASMYAGAVAAGSKWSSFFSDPVTLKYTLDYSTSLPSGVLAYADSSFTAVPYPTVKASLIGDASTPSDFTSLGGLPVGPSVPHYRNDTADLVFPEKEPFLDLSPTVNNMMFDMPTSNQKALGMIPGTSGAAGSDATIMLSSAAFDFDHTNGIDAGTFDFNGVMLHEIAHAMGFISGADSVAIHLSSPPSVVEGLPLLTTLDLFRYSPLSLSMGARDISLPLPGAVGDAATRFFSIDGGASISEYFSTGDGPFGFGDGQQGGHWKVDALFGLMDPTLDPGVNLSLAWETLLLSGSAADITALDVIGWNLVPSPGAAALLLFGAGAAMRRRRTA